MQEIYENLEHIYDEEPNQLIRGVSSRRFSLQGDGCNLRWCKKDKMQFQQLRRRATALLLTISMARDEK